jgi:hypothetical protein
MPNGFNHPGDEPDGFPGAAAPPGAPPRDRAPGAPVGRPRLRAFDRDARPSRSFPAGERRRVPTAGVAARDTLSGEIAARRRSRETSAWLRAPAGKVFGEMRARFGLAGVFPKRYTWLSPGLRVTRDVRMPSQTLVKRMDTRGAPSARRLADWSDAIRAALAAGNRKRSPFDERRCREKLLFFEGGKRNI